MYFTAEWNDWRLMYVEGGVTCWAASAPVALSGGAAASSAAVYLASAATAALRSAWGCDATGAACALLPAGVAPAATVVPNPPAQLSLVVYPAPPPPGRDSHNVTAPFTAAVDALLASWPGAGALSRGGPPAPALPWSWSPAPCAGADARRLPPTIPLTTTGSNVLTDPGSGPPATLDPTMVWTPQLTDSINQVSDEVYITEQPVIYPNGNVRWLAHFMVDYAMTMEFSAFPFDMPVFLATRRSAGLCADAVRVRVVDAGFSSPPHLQGWFVNNWGTLVCSMRATAAGGPLSPCEPGDSPAACQDVAVFWLRMRRDALYHLQNYLAPITLVTLASAAAYFNDLDAYELRCTIMATALLSQMTLQSYVSASLPQTSTITFIHAALYTSYALMGFGVVYVVAVSHGLALDIEAARMLGERLAASDGIGDAVPAASNGKAAAAQPPAAQALPGWVRRGLRALASGQAGVKHWQLRLFYAEAAALRAAMRGAAPLPEAPLLFFPDAALIVSAARASAGDFGATVALKRDVAAVAPKHGQALSLAQHDDNDGDGAGHKASRRSLLFIQVSSCGLSPDGSGVPAFAQHAGQSPPASPSQPPPPPPPPMRTRSLHVAVGPKPYIPHAIQLRRALVNLDQALRVLHMGIYGAVLAVRLAKIRAEPHTPVTCDNLLIFLSRATE